MAVLRGILATLAGVLLAAAAGFGLDLGNQHMHWVEPAYGFMYVYPWLTAIGGVLAGALAAGCFAAWNRGHTASPQPSPAHAVLAAGTGLLWALLAGILFDYANGNFGWLTPLVTYPYIYTWLAGIGGGIGAVVAVGCYAGWHLTAPAAGAGQAKATSRQPARASKSSKAAKTGASAGSSFTSARQQASGFADVPGMPLDDFKSALTPGDKAKE
jgi:hypothetical protein